MSQTAQLLLFIFSMLLAAKAGFADVYKWTDDKGTVHYTQHKPLDNEAELVDDVLPSSVAHDKADYIDEINRRGKERQIRRGQQREKDKGQGLNDDFNAKQCNAAKKNLQLLHSGDRVTYVGVDGNDIDIADDEKESRIAEANKQIQFYCQ